MYPVTKIFIDTNTPYDVLIGKGLLSHCGERVRNLYRPYRTAVLVTDDIVAPLYAEAVEQSLQNAGLVTYTYVFPHGEQSKSVETLTKLTAFLCDHQLTRSDLLIALGGGVVGDLVGFAASIYKRGIDYIQIPTSLLAAVDSSIGGKTAVNLPQGKNLIGTFYQPKLVLCDTQTLNTLSKDALADGTAECIKYGCIRDAGLFTLLERGNAHAISQEIISRCISTKVRIVEEDEQDFGIRQILNFGHTVGQAIEACCNFTISHGKAVSIGMCASAAMGEVKGITPAGTTLQIKQALEANGLPVHCDCSTETLAAFCSSDKKRIGEDVRFVFLDKIGRAVTCIFPSAELERLLVESREVFAWIS